MQQSAVAHSSEDFVEFYLRRLNMNKDKKDQTASRRGRNRFFFNNDGQSLLGWVMEAPIGENGLVRSTIDPLRDTQIDTLMWTLGTDPCKGIPNDRLSDWYSHNTSVGPRWGEDRTTFSTAGAWRIYENARDMIEKGLDPPAVVVNHGHEAGMDVFISMRVNDMHDGRLGSIDHRDISPNKRKHPDWLLGRLNVTAVGRDAGYSQFAYNFAMTEVREYKYALAREAIAAYDLDGFEMDFCRFPRYFPQGEARRQADKMTDLLQRIRAALKEKSQSAGRKLKLSVRVPAQFEIAMNAGLDIRTWISEGVVDFVVAGGQSVLHRMPSKEFLEAAEGTEVKVIAQCLGIFRRGRPLGSKVLWDEKEYFSDEMRRATAALNWMAGFDGIYVFNNHFIEYFQTRSFDPRSWTELFDPKQMEHMDKHYIVDDNSDLGRDAVMVEMGTRTMPDQALPAELWSPGEHATIAVHIADELQAASKAGVLKSATLRLMILHLTSLDGISIKVNGKNIPQEEAEIQFLFNECWLDIDAVSAGLRIGSNELTVAVEKRNPHISAPLSVATVEVLVKYNSET